MKPFIALGPPGPTILATKMGYRPLGAVVGVSVVALQSSNAQGGFDGTERRLMTDAVDLALANALDRARDQATALGAVGVVDVRLEIPNQPKGLWVEVRCVGTAVAGEPSGRGKPFLTNLNGADLTALRAAGYGPVDLAIGTCFYTQISGYRTSNAIQNSRSTLGFKPFEHPDFTRATGQARAIAMGRVQASAAGSEGVVGVELRTEIRRSGEALSVDFIAVGTAVRRILFLPEGPPTPIVRLR